VQEKVEGEGYGVGVVAREGRVLAAVAHRRVREYPAGGGPSALCESVRDARLEGYAEAMIRELGWTGPAMVEFKKDDDFRLMEVNPRLWGSLPLAVAAGVNVPDLVCRLARGEEPAARPEPKAGVRVRFLAADLAGAVQALLGQGGRPGTVSGFLSDLLQPGIIDGIFDREDLRASLLYFANRLP
jgi:predicted ATP-grasp superfamily ATP-dependent carboligase